MNSTLYYQVDSIIKSWAIIGAFTPSSIDLLLKEAEMTPIEPLLDHKQRKFTLRALKLPSTNPANQLLPPTLRYGDGSAQPNEYSIGNLEWSDNRVKPRNLAQRLARNLTNQLKLDPSEGFEEAKCAKGLLFPGKTHISSLDPSVHIVNPGYSVVASISASSKLEI